LQADDAANLGIFWQKVDFKYNGETRPDNLIFFSTTTSIEPSYGSRGDPRRHILWGGKLMGCLSWIVLGLIAGALAKLIMPGRDPGGIIITILLGIAGAVVGGFLGTLLGFGDISGFDIRSVVIAVIGAIVLLGVYRLIRR
jgi:uncharacterized membrane protein YeaQ/YmgE (transglycosylase-associated protein family)